MGRYVVRKIIEGILTLLIVITVVFLLMRLLPKEYYFTADQIIKLSEEQKEDILRAEGLMDPLPTQLKNYYLDLIHGDFGVSRRIEAGVPVTDLIASRIGVSAKLGLIAFSISLVLGVLLGVMMASHQGQFAEHLGTAYIIFVRAVPSIVSLSLLLLIGANYLGLPSIYSAKAHPVSSMIMPVIGLSMTSVAGYALWARRYMVDEQNKDYIQLAKMKGLNSWQIVFRHMLRNALVPLVHGIPSGILLTIGGSFLVESFYSIPGMGPLLTDAISAYDIDVVQSLVFIYTFMSITGIILGDILMSVVDPRITLTGKETVR